MAMGAPMMPPVAMQQPIMSHMGFVDKSSSKKKEKAEKKAEKKAEVKEKPKKKKRVKVRVNRLLKKHFFPLCNFSKDSVAGLPRLHQTTSQNYLIVL